ncbi:DUF7504 family protein [Natronorubrum daqingense]|uniref:Uncharacterized protein n=1 Tax=Natronorubrum daqingense TaxID=588898 RepID=A0A1N7FPH3_9EURY|nr:hypothetical protein [Natronorubrum daqingense]APX97310.1 hypothetical protein BB347_12195 [Natronorubrum daqingense]SIS02288.1 hypothetical protein SAMN05421809_3376 [Natronorubrum daqingense]
MSSRDSWGETTSEGQFTKTLSQLKRSGASVLVVGAVDTDYRRDICHRLLGQSAARSRHRVLVSTLGRPYRTTDVLDAAQLSSDPLELISYETHARSVSTDNNGSTFVERSSTALEQTPARTTSLTDLAVEISRAVDTLEASNDGFEPAALRVGVDSLVPLLEEYGVERVFKFVHLTTGKVQDSSGMIHYHLPLERDADAVSLLEPLFDIVVELRERDGEFQEQWSINEGNRSSGWISRE